MVRRMRALAGIGRPIGKCGSDREQYRGDDKPQSQSSLPDPRTDIVDSKSMRIQQLVM